MSCITLAEEPFCKSFISAIASTDMHTSSNVFNRPGRPHSAPIILSLRNHCKTTVGSVDAIMVAGGRGRWTASKPFFSQRPAYFDGSWEATPSIKPSAIFRQSPLGGGGNLGQIVCSCLISVPSPLTVPSDGVTLCKRTSRTHPPTRIQTCRSMLSLFLVLFGAVCNPHVLIIRHADTAIVALIGTLQRHRVKARVPTVSCCSCGVLPSVSCHAAVLVGRSLSHGQRLPMFWCFAGTFSQYNFWVATVSGLGRVGVFEVSIHESGSLEVNRQAEDGRCHQPQRLRKDGVRVWETGVVTGL
jgi:hypothetical protein